MSEKTISEVARLGGIARWKNVPKSKRSEILTKVSKSRSKKVKKTHEEIF